MKSRYDYYRILHVAPDAPAAVIKASYRALMRGHGAHPDLGGDHAGAALINEAYETLSDPRRRAAYDRAHAESARERRPDPPPADVRSCPFCGARTALDRPELDSTCHACGSALAPVRGGAAARLSRRAIERLARSVRVSFRRTTAPATVYAATTKDVSLSGMRLVVPVRLEPGERVSLESPYCSVVAIVHRAAAAERGTWECAVEFLTFRATRSRGGLLSTDV